VKLKFETATIQDAIVKASRIAPTRGSALDKAAGIMISVQDGIVSVRATNTDIFSHEVVDAVDVSGDGEWRVGSVIAGAFFGKLKIGSGKTTTLEDEGSAVLIKSGSQKAKLRLMPTSNFPTWEAFDPSNLSPVDDLKAVLDTVKWAAAKGDSSGVMSGVHLDGEHAYCTDRFRIAKYPCPIEHLDAPITVPISIFDSISKTLGAVEIGVDPMGAHLWMMPDDATQIQSIIFGDDFPKVTQAVKADQPNEVSFKKQMLIDMIDTAMVFSGFNRYPVLNFIIGSEQIACQMIEGENKFLDVFDVTGQAVHKRASIDFTPRFLLDALNASPNDTVTFCYDSEQPARPARIYDGSGYESWVMPRRKGDGQDKAADEANGG
jgi:DNA polymerase III sliding clamp (beta) subunit (PCNA family)